MAKAGKKAAKTSRAKADGPQFGVHSEVGQLRKVMVCAPGRAHARLTPSNCDQLLSTCCGSRTPSATTSTS